jgi:hypothetical protein
LRLGTSELTDLPWEYLYNSESGMFLCLTKETPLVRYLDLTEPVRQLPVKAPLRILAMISSPSDYPDLDVSREWTKLNEALGGLMASGHVTIDLVDGATLEALTQQLQRKEYHIFHFVGHGAFDALANDGQLIFEDPSGRGSALSGADLGIILHDHDSLRLAVLNACEGARTSRTDPFSGAAQSLVRQGIPAVLAMQFEITDEAAITLAHEFYTSVAKGNAIDHALAVARRSIFSKRNDVEWGTPVLFMRSADGRVFKIDRTVVPTTVTAKTLPETNVAVVGPSLQQPDPTNFEPQPTGSWNNTLPRNSFGTNSPVPASAGSGQLGATPARTVRRFHHERGSLGEVTGELADWLRAQRFEVQVLEIGEGTLIQARKMAKAWQKALGLSQALNVYLDLHGQDLTAEIGAGKWVDRAAAAGIGLLVAWPAAITAAYGWYQEKGLQERVFGYIEEVVFREAAVPTRPNTGGTATSTAPALAKGSVVPVTRFCPGCGSQLGQNDRFCSGCGQKSG